jgi:hypothetical protein
MKLKLRKEMIFPVVFLSSSFHQTMHLAMFSRIGIIVIFLVFLPASSRAQQDSVVYQDSELLDYALLRSTDVKPEQLISFLDKMLAKYPQTNRRDEILFKLGVSYNKLHKPDTAMPYFQEVIESQKKDTSDPGPELLGDSRKTTVVTLRNYSARNIAEIYYQKKDFRTAIWYYKMGVYTFPYRHYSGTDINQWNVQTFRNLADAYAELGEIDSAMQILLPYMFNPIRYSPMAVLKAGSIIQTHSGIENWCRKFDTALRRMKLTDSTMEFLLDSVLIKIPTITRPFPNTLSTMTEAMDPELSLPPKTVAEAIRRFKDSQFYRNICEIKKM